MAMWCKKRAGATWRNDQTIPGKSIKELVEGITKKT